MSPGHGLGLFLSTTNSFVDSLEFDAFFADTRGPLQAYLRRTAGNGALAEDLLQESYIRFLDRPPTSPDAKARRAYLFTLATRLLRDHWRRDNRWRWLPWAWGDADEGNVPHPASDELSADVVAWNQQRVAQGFEVLSPRQRSMVWLAYVEGLDHRELAKLFSLSESSVKVLLHRARTRMASAITAPSIPNGGFP